MAAKTTKITDKEKQKRERQFYLFLVAFGGHKSTMNKLKEYFRYNSDSGGISQFFYLEYFMNEPLPRNKDFLRDGGSVFCPFLERMIKEQPFLLDWENLEENLNAIEIKKNGQFEVALLPRTRELEKKFLNTPLEIETKTKWLKMGKALFDRWKKATSVAIKNVRISESYSIDNLKNDFKEIINDPNIQEPNKRALIKERVVLIYPWAKSGALESESLHIVGVPIASKKLFYGYILVGFFQMKAFSKTRLNNIEKHLRVHMAEQASDFYLPALILCHHSLYEDFYTREKNTGINEDMPFLSKGLSSSENMLERNIHRLWLMRNKNWHKFNKDENLKKAHFIFKDRFWGSPTSIRKIEEALTWDMNFEGNQPKKNKDNTDETKPKLKTFLIAGGPGSGKDTLSKMIALFSSGHTLSKPNIFNMAALKPDWLAPPSLVGFGLIGSRFEVDGIFKKVLDPKIADDEAGKTDGKDAQPVIIFDELNSLDIDAQGTLLRILENDEIIPIGGIKKVVECDKVKKLLIVGVVNELPHQLTLEDTIKSFQDKGFWGHLLGTALYESFRGIRRLRDDLYYRFRRG